jgi:hypothetical protein
VPEVRLQRVKFKPGYQRLWRDARTALKDLMGVKFIYQKQLTKLLIRFYRKAANKSFSVDDLSFEKIVVYSQLVPDLNTFNLLYMSNMFFINGKIVKSNTIQCVPNDIIQLIISKWYYIFFRWVVHWTKLRTLKLKRLVYRKGLSSKYRSMKSKKQKSYTIPDWVFTTKYDASDIKPFMEVDFFTLSIVIIYEPYITYYTTPSTLGLPKTQLYRLYNWKYIT